MTPSFMIVDDFLTDPDAVRRAALGLDYDPAFKQGNYPGLLSTRPLGFGELDAPVSALTGLNLKAAPDTTHLHCRLTVRGDRGATGVHIDPCAYSGILYLSRDQDCRGGTAFFRHRRTGLERVPRDAAGIAAAGYTDINRLIDEVVNGDTSKPSRWERTFVAPMRFNRLILFDPWMFHDAMPAFGSSPETGRLVLLMFFARA